MFSENMSKHRAKSLLSNCTYENTKLFVPPLKYGKVVRVYDGDTIHVACTVFDGIVARFKVRLAGIDCPELRTKDDSEKKAGYVARDLLSDKISGKTVQLKDISFDKYGRILATIYYEKLNINAWMLEQGWALTYDGKGKKLVKDVNWKQKLTELKSEL